MPDHFRTLGGAVELRHKIECSDFLSWAAPVSTDDDFFAELAALYSSVTYVRAIRSPVRAFPASTRMTSSRFHTGTISGTLRMSERT